MLTAEHPILGMAVVYAQRQRQMNRIMLCVLVASSLTGIIGITLSQTTEHGRVFACLTLLGIVFAVVTRSIHVWAYSRSMRQTMSGIEPEDLGALLLAYTMLRFDMPGDHWLESRMAIKLATLLKRVGASRHASLRDALVQAVWKIVEPMSLDIAASIPSLRHRRVLGMELAFALMRLDPWTSSTALLSVLEQRTITHRGRQLQGQLLHELRLTLANRS